MQIGFYCKFVLSKTDEKENGKSINVLSRAHTYTYHREKSIEPDNPYHRNHPITIGYRSLASPILILPRRLADYRWNHLAFRTAFHRIDDLPQPIILQTEIH